MDGLKNIKKNFPNAKKATFNQYFNVLYCGFSDNHENAGISPNICQSKALLKISPCLQLVNGKKVSEKLAP